MKSATSTISRTACGCLTILGIFRAMGPFLARGVPLVNFLPNRLPIDRGQRSRWSRVQPSQQQRVRAVEFAWCQDLFLDSKTEFKNYKLSLTPRVRATRTRERQSIDPIAANAMAGRLSASLFDQQTHTRGTTSDRASATGSIFCRGPMCQLQRTSPGRSV